MGSGRGAIATPGHTGEGRNCCSESGPFGEEVADEVDVYAVLDFEATCEDRSIDGGR